MSDHYDLVCPFVVCESMGGPFADGAYVAGYEMGRFDAILAGVIFQRTVTTTMRTANLPQADLVAMRRGWTMATEDIGDGWSAVTLTRAEPSESVLP